MTLQERLDAGGNSFLVATEPHLWDPGAIVARDCRIYGEEMPWWGFNRLDHLTVEQCRVVLERLTIRSLWLRKAYLSSVRDVLTHEFAVGDLSQTRNKWSSALTLDGLHVHGENQRGSLHVCAANLNWTGGSVERLTGRLEIGSMEDEGALVLVGVRFEHDDPRQKLVIRGRSPVTLIGCHFTATQVEIARDAHKDTALIGCTHTACGVSDRRKRIWWW